MSNDDVGYYAILPAKVRYDSDLTPNAKLLYAEVTALCRKEGYCWATDEYFAELYGVSTRTIERWVYDLVDKKYLYKYSDTFRYDDGTVKRIRYLAISEEGCKAACNQGVINVAHQHDNFVADHTDKNVAYINKNNESNIDTSVSIGEPPRTQRSLDIDEAFVIWEEEMGYPLQANKTDRRSLNAILNRKGMDLDKLRLLVKLVARSQSDKYKRFSITCYTDLMYKTNDLIAWAKEKQAQQQSESKMAEV